MADLKVGDTVMYTANWIRSTFSNPGPLPFARGVITDLTDSVNGCPGIATVNWTNDYCDEIPTRILVSNLCTPGSRESFEVVRRNR